MSLQRVQPIIPIWRKEPFEDPGWLFDFKYDGFRAVCYLLISRNGNLLGRFDELGNQLAAELGLDEAIFDGEVIAADATGRPQFYDLLRRPRSPTYVAFDLLWLDGADLRPLPLSECRQRLHGVVPKGSASGSDPPMRLNAIG
jgi:bifunctional non-homologous end joining protein LigD